MKSIFEKEKKVRREGRREEKEEGRFPSLICASV